MKYQIGDVVWYAAREAHEAWIVCPDCLGKKYLTVIMGDDSQVTVDCAGCQRGYEPPRGFISYTVHDAAPRCVVIERMEIDSNKERYGFASHYSAEVDDLFDNEADAKARAEVLSKEYENDQLARINMKEKNNRTWAWNATYHRKCIKQAQRDLVYHEAKLNAALKHKKEDAVPGVPMEGE